MSRFRKAYRQRFEYEEFRQLLVETLETRFAFIYEEAERLVCARRPNEVYLALQWLDNIHPSRDDAEIIRVVIGKNRKGTVRRYDTIRADLNQLGFSLPDEDPEFSYNMLRVIDTLLQRMLERRLI